MTKQYDHLQRQRGFETFENSLGILLATLEELGFEFHYEDNETSAELRIPTQVTYLGNRMNFSDLEVGRIIEAGSKKELETLQEPTLIERSLEDQGILDLNPNWQEFWEVHGRAIESSERDFLAKV